MSVTVNGITYDKVDTAHVIANFPQTMDVEARKEARTFVEQFVQNYNDGKIGTPKEAKVPISHFAALRFVQSLESRIRDPNFC